MSVAAFFHWLIDSSLTTALAARSFAYISESWIARNTNSNGSVDDNLNSAVILI